MEIITTCMLLLAGLQSTPAEYLFRVSPGGDGNKAAGLWGGPIELADQGNSPNLYSHGYDSLNTSYTSYYGINMEYVSYDPITMKVLMIVEEPNAPATSMKHSMALGPLCYGNCAPLDATFQNFKLIDNDNPYLMDRDCDWKCGWGPFAYYDNQVYFILSAVFGTSVTSLQRRVEIRILQGCEDIIDRIKNKGNSGVVSEFPVLACSTRFRTVFTDNYVKPNSRPKIWVTKDLKIIKAHNNALHFLFQVINNSEASPTIDLIHFDESTRHIIHREPISNLFTSNIKIRGLGSVDFQNGYLCWTAATKMYCAVYHMEGQILHPIRVMTGSEARLARICETDYIPQEELRDILTGVAISQTSSTLSVYFGCYAGLPASGGVGLLQLTDHGLTKRLHKVTSDSAAVFGGSLFLTDRVDFGCSYAVSGGGPGNGSGTGYVPIDPTSTESVTFALNERVCGDSLSRPITSNGFLSSVASTWALLCLFLFCIFL